MAPITEPYTIVYYTTKSGKIPFLSWLESLEKSIKVVIRRRLERVELGNWGDYKQLIDSKGIWELRINDGSGFRIYFGKIKNTVIMLLCAGDKGSQRRDIELAKKYWSDYKGSL